MRIYVCIYVCIYVYACETDKAISINVANSPVSRTPLAFDAGGPAVQVCRVVDRKALKQ